MRQDQKFEIERAFDLLPHVVGSSWAVSWFRFTGNAKPTRDEYRRRVSMYFELLEPLFAELGLDERFSELNAYIQRRKKQEIERILRGENKEVERRYDRYADYG